MHDWNLICAQVVFSYEMIVKKDDRLRWAESRSSTTLDKSEEDISSILQRMSSMMMALDESYYVQEYDIYRCRMSWNVST